MAALLRLGPFAILGAVAAWLWSAWDRLPARYPVHWGPGGVRWADLSVRSVATPLLAGALAALWIGALGRFILRNSPPSPDPARARRVLAAVTTVLPWFLALLFGAAAVPRQGPGLVIGAAALGFLVLPASLVWAYAGSAAPPGRPAPPDGGWLFVPRPDGTGLSIVRHHPRRWAAWALIAAGPAAVVLALLLL